ncbi:OLC1v1006679C1 [Oldenlandia corymbosa var. corymbosa]|uniref:non-specific serine/threonine protein kinase n=1 Tax=Oldenlandia corymbosa var. corymbosa TaxID=529605 RepID=A0AAV1DI30_OLDCO|nr:OLC1v1006679C1 [Oldenlandia corymbosa var. corymbosa]
MGGEKHRFLMHIWYYLFLFSTLFFIINIHHVSADDFAVMRSLAQGLNGTNWSGSNPCEWKGIQCDSSGRVTEIDLSGRFITGQLTPDLNQLSSLQTLNLRNNQITGLLPSLSNLANLQDVFLDSNSFTSVPKDFLSGLTSLQTFSISSNPRLAQWRIPDTLKDSTQLVSFMASTASISGPIPDIFESFPSLQNLRLSYNNISGPLPPSLAKSGIQNLWINNQIPRLIGNLDVIGSMSQLIQVWVHVNYFTGPIPDLSGCKYLIDLQLRDNNLTGLIPASLVSLPALKNVTLNNNRLQGPMPSFRNDVNATIGTDNNRFCNPSPGTCDPQVTILLQVASDLGYPFVLAESWKGNDACQNWESITCISGRVTVINFAARNFTGTISPAIANLTSLRSLILNNNSLTGPIPSSLTSLQGLTLLDVSNNNVSGKIPPFGPTVTVKTSGNPFIGVDLPSSSPGSKAGTTRKASVSPWIVVVVLVVVITMVVLGLVLYRRCLKKRNKFKWEKGTEKRENSQKIDSGSTSETGSQTSDGRSGPIAIDKLREVTGNFNEKNILGRGGFGIVYKGQLHDGTQIAVKRMESLATTQKGLDEFKAETDVLSKVKHRNLVALVGFCVNGNERLLVYEYMPQGTLAQHLFGWQERGVPPLSWKQRLAIALDVARGVEYLHGLAHQSFIHRDLKPSNILLGDDMRAKVSDFGLVKSAPDGKYSIETRLAGTFGYLAPEYASTGRVTAKVDVFAYGVILMEIITGRKSLDDTLPEEKSHLVAWFRKVIVNKEDIRAYLDPTLEPDEETFKCICEVAELAAHCTAREPNQRPAMGHVVSVLSPLVNQWKPFSHEEEEGFGIDLSMSLPEALAKWKDSEFNEDLTDTSSHLFGKNSTGFTHTARTSSQTTRSYE